MFSPYIKRILIDVLLGISLLFGLLYAKDTFIDFLISLFHFNHSGDTSLNLSAIAYCITRIITIFLPLIMLTSIKPQKNFNKRNILSGMFITMGICYFLANSWVFYFMINHDITSVLNASIPAMFTGGDLKQSIITATTECYLFQYENAHVFNTIVWNSYDLWGILFSIIQGILYITLAINIQNHRRTFLNRYILIAIISVFVPILYTTLMAENHVANQSFNALTWGGRNMFLIFETLFICMALKLASSSKAFWSDILF